MRRPLLATITTLTLLLTSGGVVLAGDGAEKPSAGAFEPAGSLAEARWNHTLTLLPDGRVLVIGGQGEGEYRHAAEVWDPATASFSAAGSLSDVRVDYIPTLLPDGRVLVADCCNPGEVWDPATASFGPPGPLSDARTGNRYTEFRLLRRSNHTGTRLPDGRVLIIGGSNPATFEFPAEAQVIDAVAGSLEPAGSLAEARHFHTATLLPDGRVLVIGGSGLGEDGVRRLDSAEVWDPVTASFAPAGSLAEPRDLHTATLLHDGRVLIVGGYDGHDPIAAAEVWDPATASFGPAGSLAEPRRVHVATLLSGSRVLVVGGEGEGGAALASAEVWEPRRA